MSTAGERADFERWYSDGSLVDHIAELLARVPRQDVGGYDPRPAGDAGPPQVPGRPTPSRRLVGMALVAVGLLSSIAVVPLRLVGVGSLHTALVAAVGYGWPLIAVFTIAAGMRLAWSADRAMRVRWVVIGVAAALPLLVRLNLGVASLASAGLLGSVAIAFRRLPFLDFLHGVLATAAGYGWPLYTILAVACCGWLLWPAGLAFRARQVVAGSVAALALLGLLSLVSASAGGAVGTLVASLVARVAMVGGALILLAAIAIGLAMALRRARGARQVGFGPPPAPAAVPVIVVCHRNRWTLGDLAADDEDQALAWLEDDCQKQGLDGTLNAPLDCISDTRRLWELVRKLTWQLRRDKRHPFGLIGFRRFSFCLQLVGAELEAADSGVQASEKTVADRIYAYSWLSPVAASMEQLQLLRFPLLPLKVLAWLARAYVSIRAVSTGETSQEWLAGSHGLLRRWTLGPGPQFVEEFAAAHGWGGGSLPALGLQLLEGRNVGAASSLGDWRQPGSPMEERFNWLIVSAFVEDLRWAYRLHFLGRGRRRTLRCLVLVRHLEGSAEAQRLLQLLSQPGEPAPIVVVASTGTPNAFRAVARDKSRPLLFDPPTVHRDLLVQAQPPLPRLASPQARRRARWAAATIAVALLTAIAGGAVGQFVYQRYGCGSDGAAGEATWAWDHVHGHLAADTYPVGSECIGITDGSRDFGIREVSAAERRILQANQDVLRQSANGHAYINVVVLTTLTTTVSDGTGKSVAAGVNELEGSYLAQQRWNRGAGDSNKPLLRLLIANEGQNSRYALRVSMDIVRDMAADRHILVVTGMGQSRDTTQDAIAYLNAHGVPMVASTTSNDSYGATSHFFRVSPNNARQAAVAAAFVKDRLRARPAPHRAAIVFDADDAYGRNLAQDFSDALDPTGKTIVPRPYHTGDDPAKPASPKVVSKEVASSVSRICGDPGIQLVYYAGRANEFALLANAMNTPQYCVRSDLFVMAGDDVSQLTTPPNANYLLSDPLQLYFTAWAPPGEAVTAESGLTANTYLSSFYNAYFAAFGTRFPSNEHAVLAYDAVTVAAQAAHHTTLDYGDDPVDSKGVHATLSRMYCEDTLAGASGGLDYGVVSPRLSGTCRLDDPAPLHNQPTNKLVVVLNYDSEGQPKLVDWCGQVVALSDGPNRQGAWCPAVDDSPKAATAAQHGVELAAGG